MSPFSHLPRSTSPSMRCSGLLHCLWVPHADMGPHRYAQYRAEREKAHEEWLQRKKEREEKLARGEEVGPEEPDPTAEVEVGCLGLLKFLLYSAIFIVLAGKFITGSYLWEFEPPNLRQYMPVRLSSSHKPCAVAPRMLNATPASRADACPPEG